MPNLKRILLSIIFMTAVLYLYSGMSQMLPWGVPTAQVVFSHDAEAQIFQSTADIQQFQPYEFTTPKFDEQFKNKISTLSTDETFNWIVSSDIGDYNPTRYLVLEFFTQLLVAIFLTLGLALTTSLANNQRLMIVLFLALAALSATFLQQLNWWRIPSNYQLGMMLNIFIGWGLCTLIAAKWILKSETRQ